MRLLTRVAGARAHCGCCGASRSRRMLSELGNTPGVYICHTCAEWAAKRTGRLRRPEALAVLLW